MSKATENREGSLGAPIRHPIAWQTDEYYDGEMLEAELAGRVEAAAESGQFGGQHPVCAHHGLVPQVPHHNVMTMGVKLVFVG